MARARSSKQAHRELKSFLQEQTCEGAHDSQGTFTIDHKIAKRKLAAFQLASPESWILVLVQAANRGAASKLTVTQYPRQTVVAIHGARPWKWQELESVLDGQETVEGDLLAYATVVRALTGNSRLRAFVVECPDGTRASWNGQELKAMAAGIEGMLKNAPIVFEVHHVPEFSQRRSIFTEDRGTARAALVAINQALMKSCLASGVPLWCDGRKVTGIHLGKPLPPFHYRRPVAYATIVDRRIPAADFSAAMEIEPGILGGTELLADGRGDQTRLAAVAAVTAVARNRYRRFLRSSAPLEPAPASSQLLWVNDGVVVGETSLSLPGSLGLTIVASAAGLKTDLSGLEIVKNEPFLQRRGWVNQGVVKALEDLLQQGHQQKSSPWEQELRELPQRAQEALSAL
jgi:hypothetical protein